MQGWSHDRGTRLYQLSSARGVATWWPEPREEGPRWMGRRAWGAAGNQPRTGAWPMDLRAEPRPSRASATEPESLVSRTQHGSSADLGVGRPRPTRSWNGQTQNGSSAGPRLGQPNPTRSWASRTRHGGSAAPRLARQNPSPKLVRRKLEPDIANPAPLPTPSPCTPAPHPGRPGDLGNRPGGPRDARSATPDEERARHTPDVAHRVTRRPTARAAASAALRPV